MRRILKYDLQRFADDGGSSNAGTQQGQQGQDQQTAAPEFDYEKLASIISGKQSVAEETILKSYFKQQGMSPDEMTQAIAAFKQQKAAQQPDVNALQTQAAQAQAAAQQAQLEKAATLEAISLGLDAKTIPYVLRMADLGRVGQDGKINDETLKAAINKVLEDVPQLKPAQQQATGFTQVGASGAQQTNQADQLAAIFGNKK